MGDEGGVMAGANCKRYLQNKLGDRKRRRPNLTLLETEEIVDERPCDMSTRLRQATRQSTKKHLTSAISSLSKSHKTTGGSKKKIRTSKLEEFSDYENMQKQCSPDKHDIMSFRETDKIVINKGRSANNMFLLNDNQDFQNQIKHERKGESGEKYKDLNQKRCEEGNEEYNEFETLDDRKDYNDGQKEQLETTNENECNSYSCCSNINDKHSCLVELNENSHIPSSYCAMKDEIRDDVLGNVVIKNQDKICIVKKEDIPKQNEININVQSQTKCDKVVMDLPKTIEGDIDVENDCTVFASHVTPHEIKNNNSVNQTEIITPTGPHSCNKIGKQEVKYKNELSVCSGNTSPCDPTGKFTVENINDNFPSNESENQQCKSERNSVLKSTNTTMNSSLLNSTKHTQNTTNIGNSSPLPVDEQYNHYNTNENNGFAIKSSTPTLPTIINITKLETSWKENVDAKFENTCFQEKEKIINNSPDLRSSVADNVDTKYIKSDEAGPFSNPKTSIDINNAIIDQHNGCKNHDLKLDPTSIQEDEIGNEIDQNIEEEPKQNNQKHEDQHYNKYFEESSQVQQHTEFESQPNVRTTHNQHEKDIIDAADKVYTQIEEQYHHHQHHLTSIPSSYGQILNNNQEHSSNQHDHENHNQRHDVIHTHQQLRTLQHSLQQQHFSNDQIYLLQHPQEHHSQLHMHQMQKQDDLRQPHHNLPRNVQREHRQHSHLMDFLHPKHHPNVSNTHSPLHQQQQMHEVYHDLMMEEFHEERNTPYKLGLSPSTVKHENQDDGYETSAGDVLTPNSHASSTHSVTPQHHLQHGAIVTNVVKCEDQQHSTQLQQQSQINAMNKRSRNIQQELVTNESTVNITSRDPYHFIEDDLNTAANNSLRNILTPPHSHTRSNLEGGSINEFMVMQSDPSTPNINSANDMYALQNPGLHHHHHTQKQTCLDTNTTTNVEYNFAEASKDVVQEQDAVLNLQTKSFQKRRGRKKKVPEGGLTANLERCNTNDAGFSKSKERKKHDRFNGMSEEEVVKRIIPDHLYDNLDIVIIGINPGLFAAYKGHHYAGPGNHFWKCLYLSGLTQVQMNADEDFKLIKYGIGFTNMVQRATKGSADLTRKEIKEGSRILLEKLQRYRPKIAVFNGKLIFEVFSGKKDFNFGRQPECVEGTDTFIWVMPSSSARCAQLPRAADKVPFYAALKKFRDYLNGIIPHIDQSECVFTEERIKQQCEQENYKNQQNNTTSGANDVTYQNALEITNNSMHNRAGYTFDAETNTHVESEGPGPPVTGDNNVSNSFMMSTLVDIQHEKKKRGRPKKIRGQDMIDPVTGNKTQVNTPLMTNNSGEYSNILNLSVVNISSSEMPKKKRGRPKKIKPHPSMMQRNISQPTSMLSQKPNIMSIQSLTGDINLDSPHPMQGTQTNHQHVALYSTPTPHQRSIYSPMASPMASPSLNCSYTTNTPPSQPHHDKLGITNNNGRGSTKGTTADLVQTPHHQHPIEDQSFGESPPPSSPNICTVDFEPPTVSTATTIASENVNSDISKIHQRLHNNHQRSRYNSPISGEDTPDNNPNEHFQQWISPQPNLQSPAAATSTMFANSPQQSSLNYHDQSPQQQVQSIKQQQPQYTEIHTQWPLRHQNRYDDLANSPYLLSSQLLSTHSQNHPNHSHQGQHGGSDVARKSLSGLESLVDQIPTLSESEAIALSSVAAVNAQVAAAAAVESRLHGMQNTSLTESQIGDDSHYSSITGPQNLLTASHSSPNSTPSNNNQINQSNTTSNLLNSNFSVSNLAASSACSNNTNNSNNQDNYGLPTNARPLTNPNAYHHSNLMAAAVLAAAAANTPTNLSTPTAATSTASLHTSMYMDPHAHLTTHVPVNTIYPAASPHPTHHNHHHSAVTAHHHHHATPHYGGAPQHTAADYVTSNNPYEATQSNVTVSHTLHMPSPNYPYGYSTASGQSNYSTYPHSHHANHHHHGHSHTHHTAHHLAMFDRLKPSDITGYNSGF